MSKSRTWESENGQDRLRELFDYDEQTGVLTRTSPARLRGHTGCVNSSGFVLVCVDGVRMSAHRLIWCMVHGYYPRVIRHIDRCASNNRLDNLSADGRYPDTHNNIAKPKNAASFERLKTQADLQQMFAYDPIEGILRWKCDRGTNHLEGKPSGTLRGRYLVVEVTGVQLPVHRVIWCLVTGKWPAAGMVIDHINGSGDDNRIENLREVTPRANARNQKRNKSNTSGVPGVIWNKAKHKWMVRVNNCYGGLFDTLADAYDAANAVYSRWGFSNRHGGRDSVELGQICINFEDC